ncbi:MAG: prephenate dehydratase [Pseudomonadales bacterium]|jgi:chorismate mutase/prephenate dehydratase|nr:prephenate dehydratase [Pseudomonadales bacterium]
MSSEARDPGAALAALRRRIDEIDQELQRLLNARAAAAQEVARVKLEAEPDAEPFFYRPEREAQVLRRVKERNRGPMGDEEIARLFREIMSCCLALEQPLTVAFLGPEGTFTEAAATKHFGHFARARPMASIGEVFREVESGAAHYGVVPVENSTEGVVNHTLDSFMASPLKIAGEVELRIHHHLLVRPDTERAQVRRILSHQQSLAQCRAWLDQHWPGVERIPTASNAEAAALVAQSGDAAAIAGDMAAERYGLVPLSTNIEDHPDNTTRFLVIGRQTVAPSGRDKTTLLVSTRNEPGALYRLLEPFHRHGLMMTRLETRPSRVGNWSYVFFIDFEGHQEDPEVGAVLAELREIAIEVKSLGSYPRAVL